MYDSHQMNEMAGGGKAGEAKEDQLDKGTILSIVMILIVPNELA